jgi:hypothetical protein
MNMKRLFFHSFAVGVLLLLSILPASAQSNTRAISPVPTPSAFYSLPEADDEVLVAFINGAAGR